MYSKIIVIEPSFVLRKGIVALLRENFSDITVFEEARDSIIPILSSANKDVVFLLPIRLYLRNKELLESEKQRFVLLTYKNTDVPYVNYLKTMEEEFITTIELALGTHSTEQKDEDNVLTESERNVLRYVALGFSNKDIANKLFISVHTVTTHRKHITRKLDIKSVSGLTVYAILNKIVAMNEIQS